MAKVTELAIRPFPRALHREHLVLGGEREPVIVSCVLSAACAISCIKIPLFLPVIAAVQIIVVLGLRRLAKIDPRFLKVYLRHIRYQSIYMARAVPTAPSYQAK